MCVWMLDILKGMVSCISVLCSQLMRQIMNRHTRLYVQRIAIVVTDGYYLISKKQVDEAKREHVKILVVGALR